MKTFIITVSGQTEVDIYNAISHVQKLVHNRNLSGEGTLVRGLLEGFGKFNFKSFGNYERVLNLTVEQELLVKEAEALLKKSSIYFEDRHDFEVRELSQEERIDYEKRNPDVVHTSKNPTSLIVFDIIVSGESEYGVEKFIKWVYDKVCQGTLFCKLSSITMLPGNTSGYCSFESYGKYQSTYDSIIDRADQDVENYYSGSYNNNESKNSYCSACQQDPCECSDREKTSTVHDF